MLGINSFIVGKVCHLLVRHCFRDIGGLRYLGDFESVLYFTLLYCTVL